MELFTCTFLRKKGTEKLLAATSEASFNTYGNKHIIENLLSTLMQNLAFTTRRFGDQFLAKERPSLDTLHVRLDHHLPSFMFAKKLNS